MQDAAGNDIQQTYIGSVSFSPAGNYNNLTVVKGSTNNFATISIPNVNGFYHYYNNSNSEEDIYIYLNTDFDTSKRISLNGKITLISHPPDSINTDFSCLTGEVYIRLYKRRTQDAFAVYQYFDYLNLLEEPPQLLIYDTNKLAIKITVKPYYDCQAFFSEDDTNLNLVNNMDLITPSNIGASYVCNGTTNFLPELTIGSTTYNGLASVSISEFSGNATTATVATYDDSYNPNISTTHITISNKYLANLTATQASNNITLSAYKGNTSSDPAITVEIPYNNGMRYSYNNSNITNYPMHYASFDPARIAFGGDNAGSLILGKIEVYPYADSPNSLGEVYFHFCWSKNSNNVIKANYFDPYDLFGNKEFAFIIENSTGKGILSIPRITQYATYKIEAYKNNDPIHNLISGITTVVSASALVDSTKYSIYTTLPSDAETGRYYAFNKQTIVDRLSGKTINAIVTSASNDSAGHNLSTYYLSNVQATLNESGTLLTVTKGNNSAGDSSYNIPDQSVFVQSATAGEVYITGTNIATSGYGGESFTTSTKIDLATGAIIAPMFSGNLSGNASTATKATQDANGNNIRNTYISSITTSITASGTELTIAKGNNSDFETVYVPNDKVYTQSSSTGTLYLTGTITDSDGYVNEYFNSSAKVNLTNGNITAPKFIGTLSGNASTATKATQDGNGNNIRNTYISSITSAVNSVGTQLTITKGNNSDSDTIIIPDIWKAKSLSAVLSSNAENKYDLNSLTTPGRYANGYAFMNDVINKPISTSGKGWTFEVRELNVDSDQYLIQEARDAFDKKYFRYTTDSAATWSPWKYSDNNGAVKSYISTNANANTFVYANFKEPVNTNASHMYHGKVSLYPFSSTGRFGEVYFNFYYASSQQTFYSYKHAFDPYDNIPSMSIIFDNDSKIPALAFAYPTKYVNYDVEVYDVYGDGVNATNLISNLTTTAPTGSNLSTYAFTRQTILDRLSGKTLSVTASLATSAANDIDGNAINSYVLNITPSITDSGAELTISKGNTSIEAQEIFIPTNKVLQSSTVSNVNYGVLLAHDSTMTSATETTYKNNSLTYNPSTSTLTTPNLSVSNSAYLSELTASTLSVNGQVYFENTPTIGGDSVQLATIQDRPKRYYNTAAVGSRSLYIKIKQPNENAKGQFNGNIKLYEYGNNMPPKVGDIPFDIYYNADSSTYQNGYYYDQFNNVFSSMSLIVPSSFGQNEEPYVYLAVPYVQYGVYAADCYKTFTTGNSGDNLVLDVSASTAPPNVAAGNYATFSLAKVTAPIYNGQTV